MLEIIELFKWVSEFIRVLLYVEKYNFFGKEKLILVGKIVFF